MDMYLELKGKEIKCAISHFVKKEYNKVLAFANVQDTLIDTDSINERYCKNIQAISIPKEDVIIRYGIEEKTIGEILNHKDFEKCINNFFLKKRNLKIIGDINFYLKFKDIETIKNFENGANCFAGRYIGTIIVGFQVRNKELKVKIK